jgi:hypothetical protein
MNQKNGYCGSFQEQNSDSWPKLEFLDQKLHSVQNSCFLAIHQQNWRIGTAEIKFFWTSWSKEAKIEEKKVGKVKETLTVCFDEKLSK